MINIFWFETRKQQSNIRFWNALQATKDKPSTIVGAGTLLARRGVRVFRDAFDHPCPVVPVDMVADTRVV